jgi:hypothetical protein
MRNDWRASLVPAAAVIPAPRAYIRVVAVKTNVVEVEVAWRAEPGPQGAGLTAVDPLCAGPSGLVTYLEQMNALEVGENVAGIN